MNNAIDNKIKIKFLKTTALAMIFIALPNFAQSAANHRAYTIEEEMVQQRKKGTKHLEIQERNVTVTEVERVESLVVVMPSPRKGVEDGLRAVVDREVLEKELAALREKETLERAENDRKAAELTAQRAAVEDECLRLKREVSVLKDEKERLVVKKRESEEAAQAYRQKFLEKGASALNLNTELRISEEALAEKRAQLGTLEDKLRKMTAERVFDQQAADRLTADVAQQRQAVEKAEAELSRLKAECAELTAARDLFKEKRDLALKDAEHNRAALRIAEEKLRVSTCAQEQASASLQRANEQVRALEQSLEGDARRILELQTNLQGLNTQLSAMLETLRQQAPECFNGIDDDAIFALDAMRLQQMLGQAFFGKEERIRTATEQRDALDLELKTLRISHQEISKDLAAAAEAADQKGRIIVDLERDLEVSKQRVTELEQQANVLEAAVETIKAERDQFESQVSALKATEARLGRELKEAMADRDRYVAQVKLLTSEKEALEARQTVLQGAIQKLETTKLEMQKAHEAGSLADAQAHQNEVQRQQAVYAAVVRDLRATIEAQKEQLDQSRDTLSERQRILSEELAKAQAEHRRVTLDHQQRIAEKEAALSRLQLAETQQLNEHAALRKEIEDRDQELLDQEGKYLKIAAELKTVEAACMEAKRRADANEERIQKLELERQRLAHDLSEMTTGRAEAEKLVAGMRTRLQDFEEAQRVASEEKATLERSLVAKTDEVRRIRASAAGDDKARHEAYIALEKQMIALQEDLQEKVRIAAQRSEALETLTAQHKVVLAKLEASGAVVLSLEANLLAHQQKLSALEATAETIKAERDKLSEEIIDEKAKIRDLVNTAERDASAREQAAVALSLGLAAKQERIDVLEEELSANVESARAVEAARGRLEGQVEEGRVTQKNLEAKMAEMQDALEAARASVQESSKARQLSVAEVEDLREKLRLQAKEMEMAAQTALLEQQALQRSVDQLKESASEASGQVESLTTALAQAEAEKSEVDTKYVALFAAHERATKDVAAIRENEVLLAEVLRKKEEAFISMTTERDQLRQRVNMLASESAEMRETIEAMTERLAALQGNATFLETELDVAQEALAQAEESGRKLKINHDKMQEQLAAIQAARQAEYDGILRLLVGPEADVADFKAISDHIRELKRELDLTKIANGDLEDALHLAAKTEQGIRAQLDQMTAAKDKTAAEMARLGDIIIDRDRQLDEQVTELAEAETALRTAERERSEAVTARIELSERVEELEEAVRIQQRSRMGLEEKIRELEHLQAEQLSQSTLDEREIRRLTLSKRNSDRALSQHQKEYEEDVEAFEMLSADFDTKKRLVAELTEALSVEKAECQRLRESAERQEQLLREAATNGMEALRAHREAVEKQAKAEEKVLEMQGKLESLQSALELLPAQVEAQKARNVELQKTVDQARAEAEAAKRDLDQRTVAFQELRAAAAKGAKELATLRQQHEQVLEQQGRYEKQKEQAEAKYKQSSSLAYKLEMQLRAKEREAEELRTERDALRQAFGRTGGVTGISETHDAFSGGALGVSPHTPKRDSGMGLTPFSDHMPTGMTPALQRVAAGLKGKRHITQKDMTSLMAQMLEVAGITLTVSPEKMMDSYRAGSPVKRRAILADRTNFGSPNVSVSPFGRSRTKSRVEAGTHTIHRKSDIFG